VTLENEISKKYLSVQWPLISERVFVFGRFPGVICLSLFVDMRKYRSESQQG
jgi:hypothetical protein